MANIDRVLLPAHYVSIDTNASPVTYIPEEVLYKVYELINGGSSGNDATISLTGVDDVVLQDGESVQLIYSNIGWLDYGTLPNLTIRGDIEATNISASGTVLAEEGIKLLDGVRKSLTDLEIASFVVSSTNWYRIAIMDGATCRGPLGNLGLLLRDAATSGTTAQYVEFGHYNTGVGGLDRYLRMRPKNGGGYILGWRLAYGSSFGDDAYIEVLIPAGTYTGISCLSGNLDAPVAGFVGAVLIQPVLAGVSANYLVAGSEFPLETGGATYIVENLKAHKASSTELRCTMTMKELAFPNATTLTIIPPSNTLNLIDGTILDLGSIGGYTTPLTKVSGNIVNFRIIAASGTPFATTAANAALAFLAAGATSGKIVLS